MEAFAESGVWDSDLDDIDTVYEAFLVGELEGELIAMAALREISSEIAELKRMRVHPDQQGQGYGKLLLRRIEELAESGGYRVIQLDTTVKQSAAQGLYEKFGYLETRRETEGWPIETIFYSKRLL